MIFSHDHAADLETLAFDSPDPWALVRFADGERAILEGREIQTADGWTTPGSNHPFTDALWDSLCDDVDGYHVGLSCPCCDAESHQWYMELAGVPPSRRTYSNIWANANTTRATERLTALVRSGLGIVVHPNRNLVNAPINETLAYADTLSAMSLASDQVLLIAAGPATNIIIHRYWRDTPPEKRRTIVDIGSALDPFLRRQITRGYHHPDHPNRSKVCRWS